MTSYLKHAPQSFDEIVMSSVLRKWLSNLRQRDNMENMLFYGQPGVGKSLVARHLGSNVTMIRCDGDRSPTDSLKYAYSLARSKNLLDDARRIVVLDEIDRWDKRLQEKTRALIDETGLVTTFIATTNSPDQVIDALRSRLMPVCFDVDYNNLTIKCHWRRRLEAIYRIETGSAAPKAAIDAAMLKFPDGRQMIAILLCPVLA
jgi:replication-associated recombination protein RarA